MKASSFILGDVAAHAFSLSLVLSLSRSLALSLSLSVVRWLGRCFPTVTIDTTIFPTQFEGKRGLRAFSSDSCFSSSDIIAHTFHYQRSPKKLHSIDILYNSKFALRDSLPFFKRFLLFLCAASGFSYIACLIQETPPSLPYAAPPSTNFAQQPTNLSFTVQHHKTFAFHSTIL